MDDEPRPTLAEAATQGLLELADRYLGWSRAAAAEGLAEESAHWRGRLAAVERELARRGFPVRHRDLCPG